MTGSRLILIAVLLQQGLFALGWYVLARIGVERRASVHWMVSTLVISVALALVALRGEVPAIVGYGLGPWLVGVGFALLHRGVRVLAERPPGDAEHAVVLSLMGLALAWVLHRQAGAAAVVAVASWVFSWQLLRVAREVRSLPLSTARVSVAGICGLPFLLIGLLMLLRGVVATVSPSTVGGGVQTDTGTNHITVIGFLVTGILMNLGLMALVMARLVLRLRHLSEHDALTGLLNRGAIEALVVEEHARMRRYGQAFSVLSLDVDHFKHINDRHGHPAGDAVLRCLGQVLMATGRTVDRCGRAGGEEFWMLLPGTGLDGARQVADRLLQDVRALRLPEPLHELRLTISVGMAVCDQAGESIDQVLRRLDAAVYRAKHDGRDRVVVAELSPPSVSPRPATTQTSAAATPVA
jgi:diguanylate cyclase (GGDEF)-like protein